MIGTNFDYFRNVLSDSSQKGIDNRKDLREGYFVIKMGAGALGVASALITVAAVISSLANPILGTMTVIGSGTLTVFCREVFNIAENTRDMLKDGGLTENLTADWFISSLFKNTWIAGPVFGEIAIEKLNRAPSTAV